MPATATIRELRNHFPKIRKMVEQDGEVLVTDQGRLKYRLTAYTPVRPVQAPAPKNYMARLRRHQPRALSAAVANALHKDNRGDR